jgi:protein pelota
MQILKSNWSKGETSLKIENLDDLWTLYLILEPENEIEAVTERKIRIGKADDRNPKFVRKTFKLKVIVEKTDLSKQKDTLRVSGKINSTIDDITKGSYHTINLVENSIITIFKKWKHFEIEKIKEATEKRDQNIIFCIHDREEALFVNLLNNQTEILAEIKGSVSKKTIDNSQITHITDFYSELIKKMSELLERKNPFKIIIASPGFFKEDLAAKIENPDLKKKTILATCSSVSKNAIQELIKRDELKQVLQSLRAGQEIQEIETLFEEISKEGAATYGLESVRGAANAGAIKLLLITDKKIIDARENNQHGEIENIMKLADANQSTVRIIHSNHEGGQKLDGIGGIAAILRYKIDY